MHCNVLVMHLDLTVDVLKRNDQTILIIYESAVQKIEKRRTQ